MNISKHLDFFNPSEKIKGAIHIIGCGAIGSTVAEMLVRMGIDDIHLYDFDIVNEHNLANQMFMHPHILKLKTDALSQILHLINPELETTKHDEGWLPGMNLSGYVFLCVDNIDTRRAIVDENYDKKSVLAMFDFRMRLTDAQHYAADWYLEVDKKAFRATMEFTHEEAKEATPISACGTTLSIIPTVRTIVAYGTSNFINFLNKKPLKKIIIIDAFTYMVDAF